MPKLQLPKGSWSCEQISTNESNYHDPNVDMAWSWTCGQGVGSPIEIYIGHIMEQKARKRILSPVANYPGRDARWSYNLKRPIEISFHNDEMGPLHATLTTLQHSTGENMAIVYWYQFRAAAISDDYRYRLNLLFQKLMRRPTDAAIVRISAPFLEGHANEIILAERELASFIYPEILKSFS